VIAADSPRTTPLRIDADRAAGRLEIGWADGHASSFDTESLRWLCPCAFCRGEAGLPGWLDSKPVLTPDQTRLVDVRLVGQYALQPIWADGHATGYYTFRLLRERCPCPEDVAAFRAGIDQEERRPAIPHRHEESDK